MTDRLFVRSLVSALIGHLSALGIMMLLSLMALSFEDPTAAVLPLTFVSLGMGAVVTGIGIRRGGRDLLGALLGGCVFSVVPFVVSFFGKAEFFTWGVRFLILFIAWSLVMAIVLLFPQRKKKRKHKKPLYASKR